MLLSIIIVNYNVKFFLEQCLRSLEKSLPGLAGKLVEVVVIDNNSNDGSTDYLQQRFNFVSFIRNTENLGFSKANNIGIASAKGEYLLFLNPDTIIAEDSLRICLEFFSSNKDAGAVGVHMIDGKGRFLKESKRGFPDPWVAFCRLSGLSGLFPRSSLFSKYYLGNKKEFETDQVEVLSGAFMMVRKNVLEQVGNFDERFFMYAEDIDLSFRIIKAGWKNYYLPKTTIIHFKGESTIRDSQYVQQFYKAMRQFSDKYFVKGKNMIFAIPLKLALSLRAGLAGLLEQFNNKKLQSVDLKKVLLKGDRNSVTEIEPVLRSRGLHICVDAEKIDATILCEGKEFSFKDTITFLMEKQTDNQFYIHGSNTGSIVGSNLTENRGQVIQLKIDDGLEN